MSPKNNKSKNFVGRESELKELQELLNSPYGEVRVLFIVGNGGIGKTRLVERMLEKSRTGKILALRRPLDFSTTEYRSIDGIQQGIVKAVEKITRLVGKNSPFMEFKKENQDTSEWFNKCLRSFCEKTPLILAFDTFETLDTVASNWLFSTKNDGLQVPGLICIVAGRPQKPGLHNYLKKPLVKKIKMQGLSISEIQKFYRKHSVDIGRNDFLDFWKVQGKEDKVVVPKALKLIRKVTNGHPLRVEMALNWATILEDVTPDGIKDPQTFEGKMMGYVCERGEQGKLNIGSLVANQSVFDTLACMGLITRRFDEGILKYLITSNFIRHEKKIDIHKDILSPMEKYFFVKSFVGDDGQQFYQLHDEMARLVQDYVWVYRDPSGEERKKILVTILDYYDKWIQKTKDKFLEKNLQIERLYYTLKLDLLLNNPIGDTGKQLWLKLADRDDDYINSYLPSEIKDYKGLYDVFSKHEIHERIAQIEFDAGHITQARKEWELVYELGKKQSRDDWLASALFSLANCERNAILALKKFLKAKKHCEAYAPNYLPWVYYNIGFAYRRLQNVDKAIEWYEKAQVEYTINSKDIALGALIANDLGYAYSHVGKSEFCRKNIKEGQRIRKEIRLRLEGEFEELETKRKVIRNEKTREKVNEELIHVKRQLSKARYQLGLSHNTLGEIYRYEDDLDASLRNYDTAYALFEIEKYYRWQAKALFSRAETLRRMAWTKYRDGDEKGFDQILAKAEKDIRQSLYLCEKHRIKVERDTANRRMGRVLHDRAIHALDKNNSEAAQSLLEKAWDRFADGLAFAVETGDDLEILSNQTELAFLYDDFLRAMGKGNVPQKYRVALDDLKKVLDTHRDKKFRIYQFDVFENEYKLEMAAADYQAGEYNSALEKYLDGYVGLAVDPGYGRTRYKALFPHLSRQIENLPHDEAVKWCNALIEAWMTPKSFKKRKVRLDREAIFPNMLQWCWAFKDK